MHESANETVKESGGRCLEREPVAILPGSIGSIVHGRAEGIDPRSIGRRHSGRERRVEGQVETRGPSIELPCHPERRDVESRAPIDEQIRLQLADRARELEAVPRARARDEHVRE